MHNNRNKKENFYALFCHYQFIDSMTLLVCCPP